MLGARPGRSGAGRVADVHGGPEDGRRAGTRGAWCARAELSTGPLYAGHAPIEGGSSATTTPGGNAEAYRRLRAGQWHRRGPPPRGCGAGEQNRGAASFAPRLRTSGRMEMHLSVDTQIRDGPSRGRSSGVNEALAEPVPPWPQPLPRGLLSYTRGPSRGCTPTSRRCCATGRSRGCDLPGLRARVSEAAHLPARPRVDGRLAVRHRSQRRPRRIAQAKAPGGARGGSRGHRLADARGSGRAGAEARDRTGGARVAWTGRSAT